MEEVLSRNRGDFSRLYYRSSSASLTMTINARTADDKVGGVEKEEKRSTGTADNVGGRTAADEVGRVDKEENTPTGPADNEVGDIIKAIRNIYASNKAYNGLRNLFPPDREDECADRLNANSTGTAENRGTADDKVGPVDKEKYAATRTSENKVGDICKEIRHINASNKAFGGLRNLFPHDHDNECADRLNASTELD